MPKGIGYTKEDLMRILKKKGKKKSLASLALRKMKK